MHGSTVLILPAALAVAACATTPIGAGQTRAVASLQTADGKDTGTATLLPTGKGMRLTVRAKGLTAGKHGIHIHAVGQCEGPKFASAGGHWNPAGKQHGLENPQGSHAGDMANLTVGADGTGIVDTRLTGSVADLLDADGAALVIHAKADDQKTDPSGDSGDRIACGVLESG